MPNAPITKALNAVNAVVVIKERKYTNPSRSIETDEPIGSKDSLIFLFCIDSKRHTKQQARFQRHRRQGQELNRTQSKQ